ncbi:MAG: putative acyl-CoA dehydrogenase [Acidimicrobiia bacterium]|nr:putative acyl-CoA dehydrogenase [Acidimicrobiia bacterium]
MSDLRSPDLIDADTQRVLAALDQLLAAHDPKSTDVLEFLGAQFDAGLAWVSFPEGHGGLDVSPKLQMLVNERIEAAGGPDAFHRNPLGYGMAGPTIIAHGTEAQQRKYLRPLFTGEEIWCQLFSEPGAGSDLASLATRATRDGDEWVVNGQKVWTTLGHLAKRGMLIARSDPESPKHKGLTFFLLDMTLPGVDVRPLYQMTGEAEFNEVYLTDVRVADADRIAEVGEGWRVSITTLMNERVMLGGATPPRGSGYIGDAVRLWNDSAQRDEGKRDELMRLWVKAEVLRLTNLRASQARLIGTPGPEGSIGKLMTTDMNKEVTAFCMGLLGAEGMLKPEGYPMTRPQIAAGTSTTQQAFLRMRANSIEGGTTEIMRNILGERVLALPSDGRGDRDMPWSKTLRS